jgi:thiol:disulfide interchange protein DsbD
MKHHLRPILAAPPLVALLAAAITIVAFLAAAPLRADVPEVTDEAIAQMTGAAPRTDAVHVRAAWSADRAVPGEALTLAVVVDIDPGFHINPDLAQVKAVGDFVPYPTSVRVVGAAEALTLESARFPKPHPVKVEYADGELLSFSGHSVFYVPMRVAKDAGAAGAVPGAPQGDGAGVLEVQLEVEYQACDDKNCLLPQVAVLSESILLAAPGETARAINEELFEGLAASAAGSVERVGFDLFNLKFSVDASTRWGFILLLLTAMVGGFLLNFTPCVLPVIPIKIMSLSNAAGNRRRMFALGVVMSLGVVFFWLALGGLIAAASGFTATNQLFQYPLFTIGVGVVIAVLAVAMTGIFYMQVPRFIYAFNPGQETYPGSFGFGIMTAVLSTPCTAPFMGAAAAWAATRPAATTLTTFAAIGIGMALPYFVLSAWPGLVKKMPRTGPASELIKQVMGLLMLAAAAYFIGVGLSALTSHAPDPPSRIYWWAVMAFIAAAGLWLVYRTVRITRKTAKRAFFGALGVLAVAGAALGGVRLTNEGPIDWVHYTPERLELARSRGDVVVMDFTAEWCLNCKSLEHGVLHAPEVVELLSGPGVTPIKVDITGHNPDGKAKLKETGRLTIPLLVIYGPDGQEVLKTDFYTVDEVVRTIQGARPAPRTPAP